MGIQTGQVRKGFHTITPYLYGKLDLIDFVKQAFGAEEVFRHKYGEQAFHLEVRIGDSMVMLETAERTPKGATVASLHLYASDDPPRGSPSAARRYRRRSASTSPTR